MLPADIPHMEIYISPRLITNSSVNLSNKPFLTTSQPNLLSSADSQCCTNFYALWSLQKLELSRIMSTFRGVICRGTCFHSGSQCSVCWQHQGLVYIASYLPVRLVPLSMCIGFSQPPILASLQSFVHRSG